LVVAGSDSKSVFSEEHLKVCDGVFREDSRVSRPGGRVTTQTDREENFERLALLLGQVVLVSVYDIALRKTLPPYNLLLGMEISPEVVQPFVQGRRVYFVKRCVDVLDPGNQIRRKFSVTQRTLFRLVERNV
jgi:hypothetical protein